MIQQKVEIRFLKSEVVRFISHHDLMRAMMRAVRRAGLPVRLTEGFNPRPRIVFPVALELGVASLDEAVEIEFNQWLDIQEVSRRLASVLPPGLALKAVQEMPANRAGRIPERIHYLLHLHEAAIHVTPEAIQTLLQAPTLPYQRQREKRLQSVDLRLALLEINRVMPQEPHLPVQMAPAEAMEHDLEIAVRPSQSGSARPLEILSLLTGLPLVDLRRVRVTKTRMDLCFPPETPNPETAEDPALTQDLDIHETTSEIETTTPVCQE
ncbi:MAG: TIGR03936 family radical SAM-associated protein [Planctomycetota bacterium]